MPQVQQLSNILPAGGAGMQIPFDVKQRLLADQLAQQTAAAPKAPYTSRTAGLVSALTGGLGGLMEGMETQRVMQGNRDANARVIALAQAMQQQQPNGQAPAAQTSAPQPAASQGGVGSDRVASASHTDFVNSIMPQAQRVADQTGLDPRLVAAQAALESNYGRSAPGNNLFGIKGAGSGPVSTMESINGQMVPTKASFAAYDTPDASFDGYSKLMSGSRYAGVRGAQGLDAQLDALGKSGYATDPDYAAKVGAIARGIQAPQPAPGQQAAADPSQTAPDASLRQTIEAAAAPQGPNPDAPAPNATPVSSSTLPPGVTADMMGSGTPPAAPASPYGAGPQPMAAPSPDDQSLRAALLAAQAQHDPDAAAALPSGALSAQADTGAGNMLPASPPLPPPGAQSPYGGPPQPMAPPVTPPSAMANAMAGQSPAGAMGLSTDHLPGFDNFDQNGDVTQSSTGGSGFTGDYADGLGSQVNGNLPAPGYAAGGPGFDPQALAAALSQPSSPAPFTPDPVTTAKFNATQANGLPVGSSGASQPSSGAGQPSGPLPQTTAQNLAPAAPQPGTGAALPQTGPTPPARPAGIGLDPDAPASGSIATSAPGLPASMTPQPMGLPGHAPGADPMSAQASLKPQALAQALQGGGGAQPPTPTPQMLASAMSSNGPATPFGPSPAPQGGTGQPAAPSTPQNSGQGSGGLLGGLGNMLGMGGGQQPPSQSQSAPPPASGPMSVPAGDGPAPTQGGQMAALGGMSPQAMAHAQQIMSDPYATPEMKNFVMQKLFPQPQIEKTENGDLVLVNPQAGTTRLLYQGGKPVDMAPGHQLENPNTGAPIGGQVPTPDRYRSSDGSILDSSKGTTAPDPNAFQITEMDAGNGVKVPVRIGRNPDGSPNVQVMTPGGAGGTPGSVPQPRAPITFGGPATSSGPAAGNQGPATPSAAAPSPQAGTPSPFGPQVDSMVARAGALQAQQAGAKASAEANAKNDVDEVAASRTKLESLRQSGQDLAQAQAALDSYKGKMPTGPFGQNAIWAQGVANTVGLGDPNQLSNMEIFAKNATKVASSQIKEFTSKGTNLDLETELKNNPGVNVSDQSNRILIDHLGRTNQVAQQYENAKQGYYDQNGTLRGFQPAWEQSVSGANAIPLSKFPITTKTIGGQTYSKVLSTDPSGYSWTPAGSVQ